MEKTWGNVLVLDSTQTGKGNDTETVWTMSLDCHDKV